MSHLCEGQCDEPAQHTCVQPVADPTGRSAFVWCNRQAVIIRRVSIEFGPGEVYHNIPVYECDRHIEALPF